MRHAVGRPPLRHYLRVNQATHCGGFFVVESPREIRGAPDVKADRDMDIGASGIASEIAVPYTLSEIANVNHEDRL